MPVPPPTLPFLDHAAIGILQCLPDMLGFDVESVHIVEPAIGRLGDNRAGPALIDRVVLRLPVDDRIAHDADGMGVCDPDGTFQHAAFLHPGGARHLTVAVECKGPRKDRFVILLSTRMDDGNACPG